jgi:hypothetical protein
MNQQITMKDAVSKAKFHLMELYADDTPEALALEEIKKIDQNNNHLWAVTFGFLRNRNVSVTRDAFSYFHLQSKEIENRVYKTVMIDATTGDFVKMDIRQVS